MKSLSLSLLGLVLISVPGCLSKNKQCFSLKLKPSYPCCTGDKVVLTDENGNWGIENNEWCGIGESTDTCFSVALGYPCCKNNNKVVYTDESGDWGVEDGKWCGIDNSDSCFATDFGYPCCESCKAVYSDERGDWGKENSKWCGLKKKCASSHDDTETETETETENENEIDNDFELSFMKLENEKKNMLYSPLSIKYALSMLKEGAGGNTYTEIINLIGNKKLPKYTNVNETLSLANGLFIRDIYYQYVNPEYINVLERKYEAEVIEDKFSSAYNVNKWIEDKTLGIIKNMLSDEIVKDETTEMLIINALAIDMELIDKFYPEDTTGLTFYLDDGTDMKATTMRKFGERNSDISYYKDENLTVLSMNLKSYEGTQLEFIALMPEENLSAYVENVTKEQINKVIANLKLSSSVRDGVNIHIPKFKFNYNLKLKDDLIKLGVNEAFTPRANLTKIANPENPNLKLQVTDALHKADIDFTEKGVKAAAVTVIVVGGAMAAPNMYVPKPVDIFIDKPFMFIVRDKITNDIWFSGTVYKPNSWENEKNSYKKEN